MSSVMRCSLPALAVLASLGCSSLLGITQDVASGPCTTNADCAPDEVCIANLCNPAAALGGSSGSAGTPGAGASAGSSSTAGASGSSSTAGASGSSSTAGASGSAGTPSCGDTLVGQTADCAETPDGTPINFPGGMAQGPCAMGTKLCKSDGTFGPCMGAVAPGQTDCSSSADANCDGKPDNTQCGVCTVSATQYCYDGPDGTKDVGTCHQGTQVCQLDASGTSAVWGPCAGEVTPTVTDGCDTGNDSTCNGTPNEGCSCINGEQSTCGQKLGSLGDCAGGTTKCIGGVWGTCSITAKAADTCDNGDDATCNGKVNEGCLCLNGQTQQCGTSGTGCTLGTSTCSGGNWGACTNNVCGDFAVNSPTQKCSLNGPNGEDAQTTCSIPVCSAGYHVTNCNAYASSGSGSCDFNGYDFGNPTYARVTATKSINGTSVGCSLNSCTCRRDGF